MDDTIFDHSLTCRASLRGLRSHTPTLQRRSLTDVWREYLRLLDSVHPTVLAGQISVTRARQERFRRLASFCGESISALEAQRLSVRYRALYRAQRRAVPGARGLLERLHNRAVIAIVTNSQSDEQEEKLAFLGFRDLVDHLVVSEDVGVSKPDPRIFQIALDRAGTTAEEAVMLGNSWETDILGARSAGVRAVWFNRFHEPNPEPGVVAEIDTLEDPARVERALAASPTHPSP